MGFICADAGDEQDAVAGCRWGGQRQLALGAPILFFTILFGFGLGPQLDHAGMRNKQKQRTIK